MRLPLHLAAWTVETARTTVLRIDALMPLHRKPIEHHIEAMQKGSKEGRANR